jgi:hypothetical protein
MNDQRKTYRKRTVFVLSIDKLWHQAPTLFTSVGENPMVVFE